MRSERSRLARLVVFRWIALVLASLLLVACQQEQASAEATIEMSEYRLQPDRVTVTVGQPFRITLKNTGTVAHAFTIRGIDVVWPRVEPGRNAILTFTPSERARSRWCARNLGTRIWAWWEPSSYGERLRRPHPRRHYLRVPLWNCSPSTPSRREASSRAGARSFHCLAAPGIPPLGRCPPTRSGVLAGVDEGVGVWVGVGVGLGEEPRPAVPSLTVPNVVTQYQPYAGPARQWRANADHAVHAVQHVRIVTRRPLPQIETSPGPRSPASPLHAGVAVEVRIGDTRHVTMPS